MDCCVILQPACPWIVDQMNNDGFYASRNNVLRMNWNGERKQIHIRGVDSRDHRSLGDLVR